MDGLGLTTALAILTEAGFDRGNVQEECRCPALFPDAAIENNEPVALSLRLRRRGKKTPDLGAGEFDDHAGRQERGDIEFLRIDPGVDDEGNGGGKGQVERLR